MGCSSLGSAQRCVDDSKQSSRSLGKIIRQLAKIIRRSDSRNNKDRRTMYAGLKPARPAQLRLKII
jgi:hypothetical protein